MIEMTPVKSSHIKAIGHDPDADELHVEFSNGSVYAYGNYPAALYDRLLAIHHAGESVGSHHARAIKGNADHPPRKVKAKK